MQYESMRSAIDELIITTDHGTYCTLYLSIPRLIYESHGTHICRQTCQQTTTSRRTY